MVRPVPDSDRRSVVLVPAFLLAMFVLGGASGYVVRAFSVPIAASTPRVAVDRPIAPCPSGSHVVVWYTGHAWGCVSDAPGGSGEMRGSVNYQPNQL
jgi:hypothetical protein